jgi:hypothetical protein
MVHISSTPMPLVRLFDFMRLDSIATHSLHGYTPGVINNNACIRREVHEARVCGIILDVGHAGVHFDLNVGHTAVMRTFWPEALSTDMHTPLPGRSHCSRAILRSLTLSVIAFRPGSAGDSRLYRPQIEGVAPCWQSVRQIRIFSATY